MIRSSLQVSVIQYRSDLNLRWGSAPYRTSSPDTGGSDIIGSLIFAYGTITDIFGRQIIEAPSSSQSIQARYSVTPGIPSKCYRESLPSPEAV